MDSGLSRRELIQAIGASGLVLLVPGLGQAQTRPASRPSLPPAGQNPKQAAAIAQISRVAIASPIASYTWLNRGKAPAGYIKGMAVCYAKLRHDLTTASPYAIEMANPVTPDADANKDALKHYEDIFKQAGMDNTSDTPPADTLRHLFVLMLGLGMRESSGRYCEGRDMSAHNTTAETAEAGLFQTSFNARTANPLMPQLFKTFTSPTASLMPSYLDLFKEGVRPKEAELENFGTGDGREFQKLSKECPFFALSFAAIGLRNIRKHWGPINRKAAEVKPDADAMFKEVQKLVDQDNLGSAL